MGISSLITTTSGMRHPIYSFYKEAIKIAQQASDATYSSGTTTLTNILMAKNLTVSSGATLEMPTNGDLSFIFADVLTVSGTILATKNSVVTQYGGSSGGGAGNIFIFARQILGTGTIDANGGNATASTANAGSGSSYSGNNGANGQYLQSSTPLMYGRLGSDINGPGEKGSKSITVTSSNLYYSFPFWLTNILDNYRILAGSGGTGSSNNGLSRTPAGGGGGGSVVSEGGNGGSSSFGNAGTGGHGGGGGGFIYICTESTLPALTIGAKGGNGSGGYISGGGGGGGGGGLVSIIAPLNNSIVTVTGGTAGGGFNNGVAGANGFSVFLKNNFN